MELEDMMTNPKMRHSQLETGRFGIRNSHTLFCIECQRSRKSKSIITFCPVHQKNSNNSAKVVISIPTLIEKEYLFRISLDKNKGWENIDSISRENKGDIYFTRQGCVSNTVLKSFGNDEDNEEKENLNNEESLYEGKKLTKRKQKEIEWKLKQENELTQEEIANKRKQKLEKRKGRIESADGNIKISEIPIKRKLNRNSSLNKEEEEQRVHPTSFHQKIVLKNQEKEESFSIQLPYKKENPTPRIFCCDQKKGKSDFQSKCRSSSRKDLTQDFYVQKYVRL